MLLRRKSQKTNSLCLGESPLEGNPSHTPPPYGAWNWGLPHVEKRQIELPKRQNGPPEWAAGVGGGGNFQITQQ